MRRCLDMYRIEVGARSSSSEDLGPGGRVEERDKSRVEPNVCTSHFDASAEQAVLSFNHPSQTKIHCNSSCQIHPL